MELFGSYTSPYVRHIRIALAQTGLDHKFVETDYERSAEQSPACRVPFMRDGDLMLTDSLSILRHLREQAGQSLFPDLVEFDRFLLVNTAMDSTINLFLLERNGIEPEQVAYLQRQQRRIRQCLQALDEVVDTKAPESGGDFAIRLGCYLSWALFRQRLGFNDYPALEGFQQRFEADPQIAATHPASSG